MTRCRAPWSIVMDNRRIFLLAAFVFIVFMLYQAWMLDYGPKPEPLAATPAAATANGAVSAVPPAVSGAGAVSAAAATGVSAPVALAGGREIHVRTDVLDL